MFPSHDPGGESTGDRYIVGPGATGAWAGQDDDIAEYNGSGWDFYTPNEGWAVWADDENKVYMFQGASWVTLTSVQDHGNMIGLGDDDHTQYHTDARALTWLGTRTTDDLPEGSNLYFTAERVDDRVDSLIQDGDGITWNYNDGGDQLTADIDILSLPIVTADAADYIILSDTSDSGNLKRALTPSGGGSSTFDGLTDTDLTSVAENETLSSERS